MNDDWLQAIHWELKTIRQRLGCILLVLLAPILLALVAAVLAAGAMGK